MYNNSIFHHHIPGLSRKSYKVHIETFLLIPFFMNIDMPLTVMKLRQTEFILMCAAACKY